MSPQSVLDSLVSIINNHSQLFAHWNHHSDSSPSSLIKAMTPWVIRSHPWPLQVNTMDSKSPKRWDLDCKKRKYWGVLTGENLLKPRVLVDFIPFGYDVDKLEIRFFELYEIVDVFVLYESSLTQRGISKPLFYDTIKNSTRFARFSDKVLHLIGTNEELATYKELTIRGIKSGNPRNSNKDMWALEHSMRTEIIRKFVESGPSPLKNKILSELSSVYATDSDADEIPSGEV